MSDRLLGDMLPSPHDDGWRLEAACRGMDLDLFFDWTPDEALKVCRGCPVQEQCLDEVLWDASAPGVFGGTTPEDRRRIRRQLRPGWEAA